MGEVDSSPNLCKYMNAYKQHMFSVYIVWALHPDTAWCSVSIYVHNTKRNKTHKHEDKIIKHTIRKTSIQENH